MIAIDMKTVMFAYIVMNFVGMVVMMMLWYQNRNKYSGLSLWVLDWVLLTGGTVLIDLQGTLPRWESMILSNSMIVGGTLALYFGLRRFAGKKRNPLLISSVLIVFVAFVAIHSYYTYVSNDLIARSYNASSGLLLACILSMWLMLKDVSPQIRQISRGTGIAFGVIVLICLIRLFGFSLIPQTSNQFLLSGKFDTLMVMLLIGATVFLVFNLVLMVNRRLYLEAEEMQDRLNRNIMELQAIFKTTSVGFSVLVNRVLKEANEAFCQLLGYSREEIIGEKTRVFYPSEEEYLAVGQLYQKISEFSSVTTETRLVRKDGVIINVIMSVSALDKNDLSQGVVLSLFDITERKQLEERANYLATFPELNPNPVLELDREGNVKYQNPETKKIFPDLAVVGVNHPFLAGWVELINEMQIANWSETVVREIKVGNEYYEQVISPFSKNQIRIYAREITKRKQAEEQILASLAEKETLLKEVHHRVKNNMQVISSLLRLQEGTVKDKDAAALLKDSQNRIQSMALVYNKLYQSDNLASVNMMDYIKELTTGLVKSYAISPSRVKVNVAPNNVLLGVDMAIPCGMIVNELVTNSLKYAFPDNRRGLISISIKEDDKGLELVVTDDGVGIPEGISLTNTSTLGIKLVTNLVQDQLGGKIELDCSQGTTFKITFRRAKEEK